MGYVSEKSTSNHENGKQLRVTIIKITESKENKSIHRLAVSGSTGPGGGGAATRLAPPASYGSEIGQTRSLRKQPKFRDATGGFPSKRRLRNDRGNTDDAADASSVWYFCARFSDVVSRGNQWWRRKMTSVFSGYQTPSHYCFFPYTAWLKTFVPYWDPGSFIKDKAGKFQC